MDQNNNQKKKPGGGKNNARGFMSLVCWALVLTIIFSYAGNYFTSAGHQSATVELYYSDMLDMTESGQLAEVSFDPDENIMHLTPAEGYVYTNSEGVEYTKGAEGWTFTDMLGETQTVELDPIVVELPHDELIDYLYAHGVKFKETYQAPNIL